MTLYNLPFDKNSRRRNVEVIECRPMMRFTLQIKLLSYCCIGCVCLTDLHVGPTYGLILTF